MSDPCENSLEELRKKIFTHDLSLKDSLGFICLLFNTELIPRLGRADSEELPDIQAGLVGLEWNFLKSKLLVENRVCNGSQPKRTLFKCSECAFSRRYRKHKGFWEELQEHEHFEENFAKALAKRKVKLGNAS